MKIGILTFHRAENFGAALQCFALQNYLESLGVEVCVLDYRCPSIERTYALWNMRILLERFNVYYTVKNYLGRFVNFRDRSRRKKLFREFRKHYLHLSRSFDSIQEPLEIDALIVGSDQVWNTIITNGYDPIYFLDFPVHPTTRKYSYAASSELVSYDQIRVEQDKIAKALSCFDALSVREKQLATKLLPIINRPVETSCDPTFLLDAGKYESMAKKPDIEGYVLVYHMMETSEGVKLADEIASKDGRPIIEIHANYGNLQNKKRHKYNLGPLEMLGYILNADTVITNSFHGLAFSLLFRKKVWVVCEKGHNARLKGLLQAAGLEECMITKAEDAEGRINESASAIRHMNGFIEQSQNYLKRIVKK